MMIYLYYIQSSQEVFTDSHILRFFLYIHALVYCGQNSCFEKSIRFFVDLLHRGKRYALFRFEDWGDIIL